MMENNMSKEAVRRAHIKAEQDIMTIRLENHDFVKNTKIHPNKSSAVTRDWISPA